MKCDYRGRCHEDSCIFPCRNKIFWFFLTHQFYANTISHVLKAMYMDIISHPILSSIKELICFQKNKEWIGYILCDSPALPWPALPRDRFIYGMIHPALMACSHVVAGNKCMKFLLYYSFQASDLAFLTVMWHRSGTNGNKWQVIPHYNQSLVKHSCNFTSHFFNIAACKWKDLSTQERGIFTQGNNNFYT